MHDADVSESATMRSIARNAAAACPENAPGLSNFCRVQRAGSGAATRAEDLISHEAARGVFRTTSRAVRGLACGRTPPATETKSVAMLHRTLAWDQVIAALRLTNHHRRESKAESGAAAALTYKIHSTIVQLNRSVGHRQAYPGAFFLGREI
jgi:hypothetical protein